MNFLFGLIFAIGVATILLIILVSIIYVLSIMDERGDWIIKPDEGSKPPLDITV